VLGLCLTIVAIVGVLASFDPAHAATISETTSWEVAGRVAEQAGDPSQVLSPTPLKLEPIDVTGTRAGMDPAECPSLPPRSRVIRVDGRELTADANDSLRHAERKRKYTEGSGDPGLVFRLVDGLSLTGNAGRGLAVRNLANTRYRSFLSRYKEFAWHQGRNVILRVSTGWQSRSRVGNGLEYVRGPGETPVGSVESGREVLGGRSNA
jgi:hypothetical protein